MKHKIILKNHLEDMLYNAINITTNNKHNIFKHTDFYIPYIVLHLKKNKIFIKNSFP